MIARAFLRNLAIVTVACLMVVSVALPAALVMFAGWTILTLLVYIPMLAAAFTLDELRG